MRRGGSQVYIVHFKTEVAWTNLHLLGPRDPYAIDDDDDLVMVDKEEADGQSPKEGSKGSAPSKRKPKRSVSLIQVSELIDANIILNGSRVPNPRMMTLSWSTQSRLAKVQT